jgi:hypothetical protein
MSYRRRESKNAGLAQDSREPTGWRRLAPSGLFADFISTPGVAAKPSSFQNGLHISVLDVLSSVDNQKAPMTQ